MTKYYPQNQLEILKNEEHQDHEKEWDELVKRLTPILMTCNPLKDYQKNLSQEDKKKEASKLVGKIINRCYWAIIKNKKREVLCDGYFITTAKDVLREVQGQKKPKKVSARSLDAPKKSGKGEDSESWVSTIRDPCAQSVLQELADDEISEWFWRQIYEQDGLEGEPKLTIKRQQVLRLFFYEGLKPEEARQVLKTLFPNEPEIQPSTFSELKKEGIEIMRRKLRRDFPEKFK